MLIKECARNYEILAHDDHSCKHWQSIANHWQCGRSVLRMDTEHLRLLKLTFALHRLINVIIHISSWCYDARARHMFMIHIRVHPLQLWIPLHLSYCISRACGFAAERHAKQMTASQHVHYPIWLILLSTPAHDVMMHARNTWFTFMVPLY